MKNHLNILPKLASFDLKCSKMRWRLGLRPRPRWGAYDALPDPLIVRDNAPSALGTLYFVSIFTSQFPFRAPPYGIPGSATDRWCYKNLQLQCRRLTCLKIRL